MAQGKQAEDTYVLGRSEHETRRLADQGEFHALPLRHFLEDAGVGPEMKVLDVGSGVGDVAIAAAKLVGPSGSVVGVEMNAPLVDTARERARAAGLDNVTFRVADVREPLGQDQEFDALVGRFVL